MEEFKQIFNDLLKEFLKAKIIVIVLVILVIGFFVWNNFNFITAVNFTISPDKKEHESKKEVHEKKPWLRFGKIIVPPSSNKVPSVIIFQINNEGDAAAHNIKINVDLGQVKVIRSEIVGGNIISSPGLQVDTSVTNMTIDELQPESSLYLHIQATLPLFKKVTLNADNTYPVTLEYQEYQNIMENNMENNIALKCIGYALSTFAVVLIILSALFILKMFVRTMDNL